MPIAQARMPMKLASIRALTGLSTTLSSRLLQHHEMPPGGAPVTAGALSTSVVGKAMLATTATTAAAKRAEQVQHQNRPDVGGLAVLVVGDRRHHQHEHQDRCDGLQAGDEQIAQYRDRFGRLGCGHGQDDAQDQADRDLGNEAQAHQALESRGSFNGRFSGHQWVSFGVGGLDQGNARQGLEPSAPVARSAFGEADGEAAARGFLVLVQHVAAGVAHGADHLVERDRDACRRRAARAGRR